jgi:hypothetical protein
MAVMRTMLPNCGNRTALYSPFLYGSRHFLIVFKALPYTLVTGMIHKLPCANGMFFGPFYWNVLNILGPWLVFIHTSFSPFSSFFVTYLYCCINYYFTSRDYATQRCPRCRYCPAPNHAGARYVILTVRFGWVLN